MYFVNAGPEALTIFSEPWGNAKDAVGVLAVGRVVEARKKCLADGQVWLQLRPGNCVETPPSKDGAQGSQGSSGAMIVLQTAAFVLDVVATRGLETGAGLLRVPGPGTQAGAWPPALCGAAPWSCLYVAQATLAVRISLPASLPGRAQSDEAAAPPSSTTTVPAFRVFEVDHHATVHGQIYGRLARGAGQWTSSTAAGAGTPAPVGGPEDVAKPISTEGSQPSSVASDLNEEFAAVAANAPATSDVTSTDASGDTTRVATDEERWVCLTDMLPLGQAVEKERSSNSVTNSSSDAPLVLCARSLDVPLGDDAPWGFRNATTESLPVQALPQVEDSHHSHKDAESDLNSNSSTSNNSSSNDDGASVVVGMLPPFACVQARGTRLGPNGQLWVHCSAPPSQSQGATTTPGGGSGGGGAVVLGWVALLHPLNGRPVLEPFPLDATGARVCDFPPPSSSSSLKTALVSSSTSSSGRSSAVVISTANDDDDAGRWVLVPPPRPRWFDDGGGTGPRARCYRNVLTKAALPFREDPSLASPVVARVALGGCLSGTGKRLVTSQGHLWLQCWLPGMPEPLWAVERNAKNGTAILTAVRGPDRKLIHRHARANQASSSGGASSNDAPAALGDAASDNMLDSASPALPEDAINSDAGAAAAASVQQEEQELEQQQQMQRAHDQRLKKRLRVYRVVSALGDGSSAPVLSAAGYGGAEAAAAAPGPGGIVELGTLPPNTLLVGGERRLSSRRANPRTLWVQLHRVVVSAFSEGHPRDPHPHHAAAAGSPAMDAFAHMYGGWLPESVTGVSASLEEVDGCDATAILERGQPIHTGGLVGGNAGEIGENDENAIVSSDDNAGDGMSLEGEEGRDQDENGATAGDELATNGSSAGAGVDRQRRGGGPDFEVKAVEMKAALASSLGHFKRFGSQVSGQVDALASRTSSGFPRPNNSNSSHSAATTAGAGGGTSNPSALGSSGVTNSGSGGNSANGTANNGFNYQNVTGATAGAEATTNATSRDTTALFDLARPLGMVLDGLRVCEASEGSQAQGAGVGNGWAIKCVGGVKVATQPDLFAKLKGHKDAAASLAEKAAALRAAAEVAMGARQATAAAEFEANAKAARLVQIDQAAAKEAVAAAAAAEAAKEATSSEAGGETSDVGNEENPGSGVGNDSIDEKEVAASQANTASAAAAAAAGAALDRAAQARVAAAAATEAAADAANAAADAELAAESAHREAEDATAAAAAANRVELTFLVPANLPFAGSVLPVGAATAMTTPGAATTAGSSSSSLAPTNGQLTFPVPPFPSSEQANTLDAPTIKSGNNPNSTESSPQATAASGIRDPTARALLAAAEAEAAAKVAQQQEHDSLDALLSPQRPLHNSTNSSSSGSSGKNRQNNNSSSGDGEYEDEDSAVFLAAQLDARRVAREAAARAQAAQHEADELKRVHEEAVANALAAKEAAAALKASQEAAALAEAQAQKEAAEAAHAAELTDLMSALDEFSDHVKKLQAQENDFLHSPSSSSSTLEPPSGGGRGNSGRKRTPPPAISPPGHYYLGALTVRLRRTPPSAAARQREAKRRAKKRRQDAALPEVVSTSIFGDSDDSDDDSSDDEDNNNNGFAASSSSSQQEPRATIYYTTDGTDPNPRFALTSPLQLEIGPGTTHVKAMAWARGCDPSPVVHAKFVVYGDQDGRCCAASLAVRAHHALFALKPVQRLRRWVFWPKRRDRAGRNIKRTSYTQLSGHTGGASSPTASAGKNRHRGISGGSSSSCGSFEDDFESPGGISKGPKVVGGGGLDSNDLARAARYSATQQGKHGSGSRSSSGGSGRPSVCCILRAAGAATVYATERVCGFGQDREGYGSAFTGGEYDNDLDDDFEDDDDDARFDFDHHGIELDFTSLPSPEAPSSPGGASV